MGPLRRGVIALWLSGGPALAEVCDKERPGWHPESGPASGLDELIFLATTLPGLGILGALTLAVLSGGWLYWALSALFSGVIAAALWAQSAAPDEVSQAAIAEGCVGPQGLSIAVCAATCAVALIGLHRSINTAED